MFFKGGWLGLACLMIPPIRPERAAFSSGFSFAFAGRGKLFALPFKVTLLGAADATSRTNLAAHRCVRAADLVFWILRRV